MTKHKRFTQWELGWPGGGKNLSRSFPKGASITDRDRRLRHGRNGCRCENLFRMRNLKKVQIPNTNCSFETDVSKKRQSPSSRSPPPGLCRRSRSWRPRWTCAGDGADGDHRRRRRTRKPRRRRRLARGSAHGPMLIA